MTKENVIPAKAGNQLSPFQKCFHVQSFKLSTNESARMNGDKWNILRIFAGFALAPLGAALFVCVLFSGLSDFRSFFLAFVLLTILIAVPITVLLAVPLFFLFRRFGVTGPLACMLGGGCMPVVALSLWQFALSDDWGVAFGVALFLFICGAASGWLFWIVAVYRNPLAKRNLAVTKE
jgi:hypothetical protein